MELMARFPDGHFDLAIVDPPYGILNFGWDNASNLETWLIEIYRVLKPDGTLICFGQQPMLSKVITFMGKRFSHELIWEKTQKGGFVNANRMPLRAHENIAVSKVVSAIWYNPIKDKVIEKLDLDSPLAKRKQKSKRYKGYSGVKEDSIYQNNGTRFPTSMLKYEHESILMYSNWNGAGAMGSSNLVSIHPTQKPVALYKRLLKLYARPDAKVLDCFLGSGSIAIACHDYGFDLTACELDKDYYNAAQKRIAQHTAQTRLFT